MGSVYLKMLLNAIIVCDTETMFAVGCLDGNILVISTETFQVTLKFSSPEKYKGDNSSYPYSIQDMICADQVIPYIIKM